MWNESKKRRGWERKIFPCLQLIYIILNALARHLSLGPVLLGKGRSFIRSSYPWRRSLLQQPWAAWHRPLSLPSLPTTAGTDWHLNPATTGDETSVWCWHAFIFVCFLLNFPSATFQHVCLNVAKRAKVNLPCRINYNKCLWKKIVAC